MKKETLQKKLDESTVTIRLGALNKMKTSDIMNLVRLSERLGLAIDVSDNIPLALQPEGEQN